LATETMFLKLPGVAGGVKGGTYASQLACDSVTWAIGGLCDLHGSAVDPTKVCYTKIFVGDLTVSRKMCVGTPDLLKIFKTKKVFATADLTVVLSPDLKLEYKLTNVAIPQYSQRVADAIPTESFVLHFGEVAMTYGTASFDILAHTVTGS
jgi:type VI protein secretion system component Hcp